MHELIRKTNNALLDVQSNAQKITRTDKVTDKQKLRSKIDRKTFA